MSSPINYLDFPEQLYAMLATFLLCLLLGIERQYHQKNAGVKTHVLVGVGACLFTLISAYGFAPFLSGTDIRFDPSRTAAQIVSGIGFLGAGVIFVNNDTVRGLTTAATVWLSAALGMACGAGMEVAALYALFLHYLLVFVFAPLLGRLPSASRNVRTVIEYERGHEIMRKILVKASQLGFTATVNNIDQIDTEYGPGCRAVMHFDGTGYLPELNAELANIKGVLAVDSLDVNALD